MGSSIPGVEGHVNCDVLVGYKAVYRVCFGMAMFFLLFSLLMVKVKSSQDPRAALHNGWVRIHQTLDLTPGAHCHCLHTDGVSAAVLLLPAILPNGVWSIKMITWSLERKRERELWNKTTLQINALFVSVIYSAGIDVETVVKHRYDVDITIYRSFSLSTWWGGNSRALWSLDGASLSCAVRLLHCVLLPHWEMNLFHISNWSCWQMIEITVVIAGAEFTVHITSPVTSLHHN